MSDAIQALNEVVFKCSLRLNEDDKWGCCEEERDGLAALLEEITVIAGDALEEPVKATDRTKPRKERVYKEIVRRIAEYFCDQCDTPQQAVDTEREIREILASFDVEPLDFTGRPVKIS